MLTVFHRNIGAAIFGAGTVLELLCVIGYIIDTYQKYAASAMAAIIVLRSIVAFALPLAAPSCKSNAFCCPSTVATNHISVYLYKPGHLQRSITNDSNQIWQPWV